MPISSSIPTLPKKPRGRPSLRLICFCNPKSFLDPHRLVTHLPIFSGGRGLVCRLPDSLPWWSWVWQWFVWFYSSLQRSVRPSSPPSCHGARRGARLLGVRMCMYCAGSCVQLKALCTCLSITSAHCRTIVLVRGTRVVRSFILPTKKSSGNYRGMVRMQFTVEGCIPGVSWVLGGVKKFYLSDLGTGTRLDKRSTWTCGERGTWHGS